MLDLHELNIFLIAAETLNFMHTASSTTWKFRGHHTCGSRGNWSWFCVRDNRKHLGTGEGCLCWHKRF